VLQPVVLFFLTLLTTMVIGARLQYNFNRGAAPFSSEDDVLPFTWIWHHPQLLWLGLPFSVALLGILLAHELGHYIACRRYHIDATLPHFLPAPTLIGTLGAFIRIRSPFRDRRELFDVGIAGPLAGMAVAIPVMIAGLAGSRPISYLRHINAIDFGWPPLMLMVFHWMRPGVAASSLYLSPVTRAAWVGLLATMLNLLPAGQLDGGHILFTFFPRLHRIVSWSLIPTLAWMGWRYWSGWYLWAAIVLLMWGRHPLVPRAVPIGRTRATLALLAFALLALTFVAAPFVVHGA
jgi:membrane-associated protease RseP (regulator of RpoE activity)